MNTTLNKGIHGGSRLHVVMSPSGVAHGCCDTRFLSFATPKKVMRTYRRMFGTVENLAPTPKTVVQDVKRRIRAIKVIHEQLAVFVPGLAGVSVPGYRYVWKTSKTSDNWEGKQAKKNKRIIFPYTRTSGLC